VSVMSRGRGVKTIDDKGKTHWTYPNPGSANAVTSLGIGAVVDTQRRRRNHLSDTRRLIVL